MGNFHNNKYMKNINLRETLKDLQKRFDVLEKLADSEKFGIDLNDFAYKIDEDLEMTSQLINKIEDVMDYSEGNNFNLSMKELQKLSKKL